MEYRKTIVVAATDADGIAVAQTLGAAGPLTLTSDPVVIGDGVGQMVTITTVDDETGVNFTFTGTGPGGYPLEITVAGPNNTTADVGVFETITSIVADDATTNDVSSGWVEDGISAALPLDIYNNPFSCSLAVIVVDGAPSYTVEFTLDPVQDPAQLANTGGPIHSVISANWLTHATLVGQTASATGNFYMPVVATRLNVEGAGELEFVVLQATG